MKKWLLLCSKPRQEFTAQRNLEHQGFEAYCPIVHNCARDRRVRTKTTTEPLFPSYVFIHTDPEVQSVAPVRSTRGVKNFVRFGGNYAIVADEIVEQIRERVARNLDAAIVPPKFVRGDVVSIDGQGFDSIEAVFSCDCGAARAVVLLSILGRQSRVNVSHRYLSKVD